MAKPTLWFTVCLLLVFAWSSGGTLSAADTPHLLARLSTSGTAGTVYASPGAFPVDIGLEFMQPDPTGVVSGDMVIQYPTALLDVNSAAPVSFSGFEDVQEADSSFTGNAAFTHFVDTTNGKIHIHFATDFSGAITEDTTLCTLNLTVRADAPDGASGNLSFEAPLYFNEQVAALSWLTVRIDTQPPSISYLSSNTHAVSTWSDESDFAVQWLGGDANGIAAYSYALDHSSSTTPDGIAGGAVVTESYPGLADGEWWFHVRAQDNAGKWSDTEHLGPIRIDTTEPTGSLVCQSSEAVTLTQTVTLTPAASDGGSGVAAMQFSNDLVDWSSPESYATNKAWQLAAGNGIRTVFVRYQDLAGNWSAEYSDSIELAMVDVSGDGRVDIGDLSLIGMHWNTAIGDASYVAAYDLDSNGEIDIIDMQMVANFLGVGAPAAPSSRTPEPVHVVLRTPGQVTLGEQFSIDVVLDAPVRVRAAQIRLGYDGDLLTAHRVTFPGFHQNEAAGDTVMVLGPSVDAETGSLVVAAMVLGDAVSEAGLLASVDFATQGMGSGAVQVLDLELVDASGHTVPVVKPLGQRITTAPPPPDVPLLLQNYPNPFNPETWIGYQLSEPGPVEIAIHSLAGELVRTLRLGHRDAGHYVDRPSAAYWDGRSDTGERVASGIYFYTLKAPGFHAVRRMVVAE